MTALESGAAAARLAGARLKVVQPGEGRAGGLAPGVGVVFKIDGEDTGGALSIVEHPFAVGALVPPHIHHLEDEYSIVLEGEIGFRSNDREVVLGPGGYIIKPRGEVHAMWNAGSTPARMIEVISPPGFERFFRELSDMTAVGAPDPAAIAALGERYRLPFAQPDWLPDVIARYHLTPPTR
jgi:quercetin dioxygenase-like cupin family protein